MAIDGRFKDVMRSNAGCAVIFAGSDSDSPHIERLAAALGKYGLPFQVRICSAHKQPGALEAAVGEYNAVGGSVAFVAVAGGTDALSGTLSYLADYPVISCPPDAPNESCLRNPPGSSNAYVARPENAARFIAQMFAGVNPQLCGLLVQERDKKRASLEAADSAFTQKYVV